MRQGLMLIIGDQPVRRVIAKAKIEFGKRIDLRGCQPKEVHVNTTDFPGIASLEGLTVVRSDKIESGRIRVTTSDLP